jgi:glutamine amidotransferase
MVEIALIDYGIGNLFSVECALKNTGLKMRLVSSPQELGKADAVVLPGVGNFKVASENIQPFKSTIVGLLEEGASLLGVCLGMQLLFEESEESAGKGLSLLRGKVVHLPREVKTPHIGWNTLKILRQNELLNGIDEDSYFYFVHSYYPAPVDQQVAVATTDYGLDFTSVLASGNIYATQFHPEKSGKEGAQILQNFAEIVKR